MLFRTVVVVSVIVLLLATPAEGWRRRRRRRRRSPPPVSVDTTPPTFTSCSGTVRATTSESDGRKVVSYSTPTATDNRGSASVSRTSGPSSGSRFNEGSTTITYQARDSAGNTRLCSFSVVVTVLRCSSVPQSSHRSHACTKTIIAGSVCTFHCPTGFNLVGYSSSTCQTSSSWSRSFPTCQVRTCSPALTSLAHGSVSCTNSNRYGSVCTFRCNGGYGFSSGASAITRTCSNRWSGTTPTCIDTQAPSFSSCPSSISVVAEDAVTSAVVNWNVPTATDNVPSGLRVSRSQGQAPGSRFNQGSHTIRYRATDSQGNTRDCTFSVTVRVITCTAHQASSHLVITCPHGHIKGASCTFRCETGYRLIGAGTSTCQSSASWSAARPRCQVLTCPTLTAPVNGDFRDSQQCGNTFDSWCNFVCDTGYSITGSTARRCIARQNVNTAFWDGTTTGCQINTCSTLSPGEGLYPFNSGTCSAGNEVTYGTTCTYQCALGYRISGSHSITCGPEGLWLQSLPQCQEITCATSDLPAPVNGVRSGCTRDYEPYGTTCTLSCNRGYTPTASVQRTCQSNNNQIGVWSAGTITCTMVTCPPPSAPIHGRTSGCVRNGQTRSITARQPFDTSCSFACNNGYTLSGSPSRTCLVSGSWDGSDTQCADVTPPVLQCPLNQILFAGEGQNRISIPWNWEPFTGTDAGHDVPAILQTINSSPVTGSKPTMLDEGTYSLVYTATDSAGNSASCSMQIETKVTKCLGLQTPLSGFMRLAAGHGSCIEGAVYGSQCEITCETGHTLSTGGTTVRRQCMRETDRSTEGFWSLSQPTCVANTCPYPAITNGYIRGCHGNTATYRDSCEFHCDLGRRTPNGQSYRTRQCQADSSWSGPDFQCTVTVTCPGPFSIPHGSIEPPICSQAQVLPYNTVCHFSCGDGFVQQGPAIKTCTDNASWDNLENVICIDEQRPRFVHDCPQHVTVNSEFGSTSRIVGFDVPSATDNSGLWTVNRQGDLGPGSRFSEGRTIVTYIATDPSSNSDQCDIIIIVVVYRCERLQAPASGSVTCNQTSPIAGTQCTLECNTGYTLSGSQSRTCRLTSDDTQYWDGQNTVCTIVRCSSQPSPAHSVKSGCSSSADATETYGTECSFYCMNGYEAETSDGGRSRCLADGTWSGTDLVCTEIECLALAPAPGVTVAPPVCSTQPVFGNSCMFSCLRPGFRVEPLGNGFVSCEGSGRWSHDVSEIRCIDIENPHFSNCPSSLTAYADRGSTTAQVTLPVTASDNDEVQPSVTCDPESGQFDIGDYSIHCIALDAAGNSDTCNFQVEVIERRCHIFSPPPFGEFVGECHSVYGSVCHLKCIDHYRLDGSSQVTCEFDGTNTYWQIEDPPSCHLVTCDAVALPDGIEITPSICTTGSPPSGSLCSFFCFNGLTLIGGVSLITCGDQGLWDVDVNDRVINCEDRIPPVLTLCPEPIVTLKEDEYGTRVTFDIPTVRDNLPSNTLTLETSPADIDSPYLFTEAVTKVSYNFTDQGGNSVICTFTVSVYDDLEPEVVYCPGDYFIESEEMLTVVTWDEPIFRDPTGHDLDVSNNVAAGNTALLPLGRITVVYTAFNLQNGQKASCQFGIEIKSTGCMLLDNPINGAISCIPSGEVCSMFCNENYEIPRPRRKRSQQLTYPDHYVCSLSGRWRPHNKVPDCSKRRGRSTLPMDMMYYSGDCSGQSTRDDIAEAFIAMIQSSPFFDSCSLIDKCNIENVKVFCGSMERPQIYRRRRGLDYEDDGLDAEKQNKFLTRLEEALVKRQRRDADVNMAAFISFDFSFEIKYEEGMESIEAVVTTETKLKDKADVLMTTIGNGTMQAMNMPNMTMEVAEDMMTYGEPTLTCEPGYEVSNDTLHCTACSSGTWYNQDTGNCEYCSRGKFQGQQAKESCMECPAGTTTASEGTKNSSFCKEVCPAGHYSEKGIVPCFKCLLGEYQPELGQTSCQACPNGTTNQYFASRSLDQCRGICPPGSYSDTGLAPCRQCGHRYYQPNSGKLHCILCPGRSTTSNAGSTSEEDCIDADECFSSPCGNEATCVDLIVGYRCDCPPGYEGVNCEEDTDDCVNHRCTNEATCVDGLTNYQCLCNPGFEGDFCEVNIDECAPSPCLHDGVCHDVINGYRCQCPSNYHGILCEQEINSCSPNPCQNGANCDLQDGDYRCLCAPGYSGINCTLDINECSSGPCQNGGNCQDMPNAFICVCTTGYEGTLCEIDVNLCAESPCHEGSTCVDLESTFRCVCPPHRSGDLCDDTPCQNGALFVLNENLYTCQCVAGYTGLNCEIDLNECASAPCSNGGTCIEHQLDAFMCECPQGFQGDTCTIDIDECLSNPCGAQSFCENVNGVHGYICHCGPGLTGSHCEEHIDYCEPSMCQHGATCGNTGIGYWCQCVTGFTGRDCETNIDECASGPCQHGGICIDRDNNFLCFCRTGFMGRLCEININDCVPSACQNGGTCIDGIAAYSCLCPDGFTGAHCEEPINYCISNPCQHSAVCQNDPPGYKCSCVPGYIGHNCQENFDDCSIFPCEHALSCVDGVNSYTCICENGYDGVNCERNINECDSNQCMHGGVCVDQVGFFVCLCPVGYVGLLCGENVDDCATHQQCLNGATCIDGINEFSCRCQQGWTGEFCEEDIDDCDSDPCMNGAECKDQLSAYECQCLPGYSGINCQTDINECQQLNIQCQHGGICLNKIADFECFCLSGYRGRHCEEDINECVSNPCQNGGNCIDEVAGFSCDCARGFTGSICDIEVDLCISFPCSNGATCSSHRGDVSCTCAVGYGGELCEIDIDECLSHPCLHQASCQDQISGYQCVCLPGYTGVHCETELSTDFDLKFHNSTLSDLIEVTDVTSRDLSAVSVSLWMRSTACAAGFIMTKLSTTSVTVIEMRNPTNLQLKLLSHDVIIESETDLCDGHWHNLLLTLHATNQEWKLYIDKSVTAEGAISSPMTSLPSGLMLTMGPSQPWTGPDGTELELSGVNIWDAVRSEAEVQDIASFCIPIPPGNVFAWGQVMTLPGDAITQMLTAPSVCDDYNECSSSPCESGSVCEDKLGYFLCHCASGWEGERCHIMIDYCILRPCLNGGTCYGRLLTSVCECPGGFTGALCEHDIIDGQWTPWLTWSECTQSCGTGRKFRSRTCDNPSPENGGAPCPGSDIEYEACNRRRCPTCPTLRRPSLGYIACNITISDEQSCHIWCRNGYVFSTTPQDEYRCGPSTNYRWDHNPENSRSVRLPSCSALVPRVGVTASVTATFPSLQCSSTSDEHSIIDTASSLLNTTRGSTGCLSLNTCAANVSVTNCDDAPTHRSARAVRKRSASQVQVTIILTMDNTTNAPFDNSTLLESELQTTLNDINGQLQTGEFGIVQDGMIIQPDKDSISTSAWDMCPVGYVESDQEGFCVQCGLGSICVLNNDDQDYECQLCPLNTYKDEPSTNVCIMCPSGMITNGLGATNISDCYESPISDWLPAAPENHKYTAIVVGALIGILLIIVGAIGLGIFMKFRLQNRQKKMTDESSKPYPVDIADILQTSEPSDCPAASPIGDALPETTPTPSNGPDVSEILHLPNTKL